MRHYTLATADQYGKAIYCAGPFPPVKHPEAPMMKYEVVNLVSSTGCCTWIMMSGHLGIGFSRCHPDDRFDATFGKHLSMARAWADALLCASEGVYASSIERQLFYFLQTMSEQ